MRGGQRCGIVLPPASIRSQRNPPDNGISVPRGTRQYRLLVDIKYGTAGGYVTGLSQLVKVAVEQSSCGKAWCGRGIGQQ